MKITVHSINTEFNCLQGMTGKGRPVMLDLEYTRFAGTNPQAGTIFKVANAADCFGERWENPAYVPDDEQITLEFGPN